jgi:two-component system, NarL family, sensor histidine kinase UhpB
MKPKQSRLYQRVFALNAAIFVVATIVLVLTPATVSFPVEATEAIVLVVGLGAILLVNAIALRTVFGPLERLTRLMRAVDPQRPGARLEASGPAEIDELVSVFNQMLDRLESERQDSARHQLEAQEGERKRIAHELHDEVGQLLTGVLAQLEALVQRAPSEHASEVRRVQETARQAIEVLSRVVRDLRPEALDELGLANALEALASRVEQQGGLIVRRRIEDRIPDLGAERELVVYRVAQEALTNALRHSRASTIALTLEARDTHVVLSVRDDGIGLPADHPVRHGILGMRERSMLIGATLMVADSRPGVEVVLDVPPA